MEMPEGLERWVASMGDEHPENLMRAEEIFRANLMTEMAEALEIQTERKGMYTIRMCFDVLKKFREWK